VYGIDGTHGDWGERNNVERFVRGYDDGKAYYWGGSDAGASGADTYAIINDVYGQILSDYDNDPCIHVDIVGWSRGGQADLEVASKINAHGIEVRFLGLLDAVGMVNPVLYGGAIFDQEIASGRRRSGGVYKIRGHRGRLLYDTVRGLWFTTDILRTKPSSNVQNFFHAVATGPSFLMITIQAQQQTPVYGPCGKTRDHGQVGKGRHALALLRQAAEDADVKLGTSRGDVLVTPSPNGFGPVDGDYYIVP
jgi:hypothetical protein